MSISTHSTPSIAYIISAFKKDRSILDNLKKHDDFYNYVLERYIPIVISGCWQGEYELSLLIKDCPEITATGLAEQYNQDCFIKLVNHKHGLYKAYFMQRNSEGSNPVTYAGHFKGYMRSLPLHTIHNIGCDYSYNTETGEHFTIWPSDTTTMTQLDQEIDYACEHGLDGLAALDSVPMGNVYG